VVELGDWALGPAPHGTPASLTLGPALLLLGLLAVAMVGLMAGFAGPALRHELVLAGSAWVLPAALLLAAGVAAWSVRRSGRSGLPALWHALTFVAVPLALLGAAVGLGAILPESELPLEAVVEASFCLHPGDRRPICLLDLRTPPELSALHRVRHGGPSRAPGTALQMVLVRPVLGPARVRSTEVDVLDWHPESELEDVFIDKQTRMSDLLRAGQVTAEGAFDPACTTLAELARLGIPLTAPAPASPGGGRSPRR
jgi:hypothetical protein